MRYHCGSDIRLGDVVTVPVPDGDARARVVMLGESQAHLAIDPDFLEWVLAERRLAATSIVVEWIETNPFAHADPNYAPVGNYMFTVVDEDVRLQSRALTPSHKLDAPWSD